MVSGATTSSSVNIVRVSPGVTIQRQRPDFAGNFAASAAKSVSLASPRAAIARINSARCSAKKIGLPSITRNVSNTPSQGANSPACLVMA